MGHIQRVLQKKSEENDRGITNIRCPFCRADNKKFLKFWSHWYYKYDYDSEDTDEEDYERESRENEAHLASLDFPLINPGESLSEFRERIERETMPTRDITVVINLGESLTNSEEELDFSLINPGESLSEFRERMERENPQ